MLVVDDDEALLETTTAVLAELAGDELVVSKAFSAEEALRLLRVERADVLVADFHMPPGMNGVELLRTAYSSGITGPGVLVTGLREQMPKGAARDEAIFAVVYKPYQPGALLTAIRDAARFQRMTENASGLIDRIRSRSAREGG